MADRVIQRNDTAARWQSINPVLATGEIGIEIDGAKGYKIGDGKTRWNDLPYPANPASIVQDLGNNENAVPSQKLVTEKLTELGSEVDKEGYIQGKIIRGMYVGSESDNKLLSQSDNTIVFIKAVIPGDRMVIYTDSKYRDSLAAFTSSDNPLLSNAVKLPIDGKNNIPLVFGYNEFVVPQSAKYIAVTLQFSGLGLPENKIVATYSEYAITKKLKNAELEIQNAKYVDGVVADNVYVSSEGDSKLLSNAEGDYKVLIKRVQPNENIIIYTDAIFGGDSLCAFTDDDNPLDVTSKKILIGGKGNIQLKVGYNEIIVPENAKYIAMTLRFANSIGLPENKFIAANEDYAKIKSLIAQLRSVENNNIERYNELNSSKVGKKTVNLFDKSQGQINGKYIGSDGVLSTADNCIASYLIPIKPNTLYSWNAVGFNTNYSRFVKADGVSGLNLLNETGDEIPFTSSNYGVIKSPSDAAYFQFTISFLGRLDIVDSACLIESDTFIDKYYEYGLYLDENELPKEYRELPQRVSALEKGGSDNPLFGKSIYFCGDSIMNGLLVDADRRLYNQIADKYGMIANNKSLDGAVFFYPMSNNRESIYWQLSQIPSDADYIIIQGGVNGANMTNPDSIPYFPMGEMTDSYTSDFDLSTQIGCVEGICKYLFENFSGKKFGFIITYQIQGYYDGYLRYWKPKADAIVAVLEKWGIPYIDWRQSGVNLAANAQNYGFSVFDYEEFSESKDYNLDDKVRYDNIGYKAKVAIKAGKPFDVTQWQQLSTKAEEHDTWHCNALAYDLLSHQTGKWIETL